MPIAAFHGDSVDDNQVMCPFMGMAVGASDIEPQQSLFYNPRALTIVAATIVRGSAAGGGNSNTLKCYDSDVATGTQTGSTVTLSDPATSVNAAIGGTWTVPDTSPGPNDFNFAEGRHVLLSEGGTPTLERMNYALLYEDTADATISYYSWGHRTRDIMSGVAVDTDRFTTFGCGVERTGPQTNTVTATESNVQMPWPATGQFQHIRLVYGSGTGTPAVEVALRIGGADKLVLTLNGSGAGAATETNTTAVSVSEGDLVSWRITRKNASATFIGVMTMGFIPS